MTIAATLQDSQARLCGAAIADARIEAEVLLAHALGVGRETLLARLQEPVAADVATRFEGLVTRRLAHEPTAYIVGHREFYGLKFACSPAALIPRPETELLVEEALRWLRSHGSRPGRIIDVGTGNGAIAVALAVNARKVRVTAVDVSRAALRLARRNAAAHSVAGRIDFVQGDLLSALAEPCELIVANLPYVPTQLYRKLAPELRDHEPEGALHAGRGGTAIIETLLTQAGERLRPGGLLLVEHAWNQGRRLREAARAVFPNAQIETKRDLAGRERVLIVEAGGSKMEGRTSNF
ncbi:MAG: peptide chain release factor N(5)-glutamine methyltransferase [Dehalococcoidia bacterium]